MQDLTVLRKHIKKTNEGVNKAYNEHFGSLFRSGSKPSFFAMQVQRYADLYTCMPFFFLSLLHCFYSLCWLLFLIVAEYTNLLNYPLFYEFTANATLMPHEYNPVTENLNPGGLL